MLIVLESSKLSAWGEQIQRKVNFFSSIVSKRLNPSKLPSEYKQWAYGYSKDFFKELVFENGLFSRRASHWNELCALELVGFYNNKTSKKHKNGES